MARAYLTEKEIQQHLGDDIEMDVPSFGAERPTSAPAAADTPAVQAKREQMSLKHNLRYTNPWILTRAIFVEFFAVTIIIFTVTIMRSIYPVDTSVASAGIGATFAFVYFLTSIWEPICVDPFFVILRMIFENETTLSGILRIAAQFAAAFTGAGLAKVVGDAAYINAAIIVKPGSNEFEAFALEILGSAVILFTSLQFSIFNIGTPLVALLLGIGTFGFQVLAYPISSAGFNAVRWLAVDAVGGSVAFWPGTWWIYPVGALLGFIIAGALHLFLKWLTESSKTWNGYKTV